MKLKYIYAGAQGQQITLIPTNLTNIAQQGGMMRGVNVGGGMMQLQPATGINAANGIFQSIPVQNIPGLGNVQVISTSSLQPTTVQALPNTQPKPIVASVAPNVRLESGDNKWQILQAIQSNNQVQNSPAPAQQQHHQHQTNNTTANATVVAEETIKPHRRRVACTCPNCGDGDR